MLRAILVNHQIQIVGCFGPEWILSLDDWVYFKYRAEDKPLKGKIIKIMQHPSDGLWFVCQTKSLHTYEVSIANIV